MERAKNPKPQAEATAVVVIPNWNGENELAASIESILAQSHRALQLVIVDNGSVDGSRAIIEKYCKKDKRVRAVWRDKNYGFTGGVNPGLQIAIDEGAAFAAPFNNDAMADKDWLREAIAFLQARPAYGSAVAKLLHADGKTFDSTGDLLTVWGLPYPRGRDEPVSGKYDQKTNVLGGSGCGTLHRVAMLREVGLYDDDIFAYYEDTDLSLRTQLAGWKIGFAPKAVIYHAQSVTSSKIKGFATYQTLKNLPLVLLKNLPLRLLVRVWPRFLLAYMLFFAAAAQRGQLGWAVRGWGRSWRLLPKKINERRRIQKTRRVPDAYIWEILTHDLPPNARRLRTLRAAWWKITGQQRHSQKENHS